MASTVNARTACQGAAYRQPFSSLSRQLWGIWPATQELVPGNPNCHEQVLFTYLGPQNRPLFMYFGSQRRPVGLWTMRANSLPMFQFSWPVVRFGCGHLHNEPQLRLKLGRASICSEAPRSMPAPPTLFRCPSCQLPSDRYHNAHGSGTLGGWLSRMKFLARPGMVSAKIPQHICVAA